VAVQFDHVGIVVAGPAEIADLAQFFGTVLGCEVSGDPADGYAEVRAGSGTIALHGGARIDVGRPGGTLIQLTSDDVDAEVAAIRARGGRIVSEPEGLPWGRSAYVAGPHGAMAEIYCP
jgi:predicted enzyme related to lactoylglutathione lyase